MHAGYLLLLTALASVEGNKFSWVKQLKNERQCWGCDLFGSPFSSISILCNKCIQPVENQFKRIPECKNCAHKGVMLDRRDNCHECQKKLKEYLARSERQYYYNW